MKRMEMAMVIGVALVGACDIPTMHTEVARVGTFLPARGFDCPIQLFFGPMPSPYRDVARARTTCPDHMSGEQDCYDDMRRQACLAGADTIYGITEGSVAGSWTVTATFAHSLPGTPDGGAAATPGAETGGCDPLCSPGFACQAGACIPQCNPRCEANEVCSRQRTCEPAQPHLRFKSYSDAPGSMGKP